MPARVERLTFPRRGATELDARLDLPAMPPVAFALFAHCFTRSEDTFAASRIAAELTQAGFGVLSFEFTEPGSTAPNAEDVQRVATWLAAHHRGPQLLVGHSLAGAAVLTAAADIASARAVATIGARSDAALTTRVAQMRRALLVLHSPIDNTVGVEQAAALFAAARHPKSYVGLDGADHLLSRRHDAVFAARMIATWAARFVVDESGQAPAPAATAQVVVAETTQGTFLNHVVAGDHHLFADEPVAAGGFDAGPSPYDLLAAALGACTSMTMRLYADRKGIPVDRITVEVSHAKIHAKDCAECAASDGATGDGTPGDGTTRTGSTRTGMVDRFERRLVLEGTITDDQRTSLVAIAARCPVHRTLEASSTIVTRLA